MVKLLIRKMTTTECIFLPLPEQLAPGYYHLATVYTRCMSFPSHGECGHDAFAIQVFQKGTGDLNLNINFVSSILLPQILQASTWN